MSCLLESRTAADVARRFESRIIDAIRETDRRRPRENVPSWVYRTIREVFDGEGPFSIRHNAIEREMLLSCLQRTGKRKCPPEEPPPPFKFIPEEPPDVEKEPEIEPEPAPEPPPVTQGPYIPPRPAIRDPSCPGDPFWAYEPAPRSTQTCSGPPPEPQRWATAHEEYDAAQDRWHLIYD